MTKRKPKPTPQAPTPPAQEDKFNPLEFFQAGFFHNGGWHWRITSPNGNIVATGAESYVTRAGAENGFKAAQKLMAGIKL